MRRALPLLMLVFVTVACEPGTASIVTAAGAAAPVTYSEPAPPPEPPPPPDHCTDYPNMEAGRAHPVNQDWFNHLPARDGDKGYARLVLACVYAGDGAQFAALDELWQLEADGGDDRNGTDWHATNVPQAKPASKMGCTSIDHRCQVRWGLRYIADRYGTPARALAAWRARRPHWY